MLSNAYSLCCYKHIGFALVNVSECLLMGGGGSRVCVILWQPRLYLKMENED
jgi:hypothetical protein